MKTLQKTYTGKYAPNHLEFDYWIDLTADAKGSVTKTYNGTGWVEISGDSGEQIDAYTKAEIDSKLSTAGIKLENALNDKANKDDVYTKEEIDNKGYLTEHQDLSDYALKTEIPTDYLTQVPEATADTLGGIKKVLVDSIAEDSDITTVVTAYNNLITKLTESGLILLNVLKNYLTIEALEDGLTVSLSRNACEYCIDGDYNWVTLAAGTPSPSLNVGQTISFKGNLIPDNSDYGIGTFTISKKCNVLGNIMSMLFGDEGKDSLSLTGKSYAFCSLFYNCNNIISAKDLHLPATELADSCYRYMFEGCTLLTTAPELPATTLTGCCYDFMFHNCTSLITAPELPSTTLAISCYSSMFENCTSLITAPELPATTLAMGCYSGMFYGCTSLNHIKMLATDISATLCLEDWVANVASTGTFIKHPDMTSLPTGVRGIPEGWTVQDASE